KGSHQGAWPYAGDGGGLRAKFEVTPGRLSVRRARGGSYGSHSGRRIRGPTVVWLFGHRRGIPRGERVPPRHRVRAGGRDAERRPEGLRQGSAGVERRVLS